MSKQSSVLELRQLIMELQGVLAMAISRLKKLEDEPRVVEEHRHYGGGGARNFNQLQGAIGDAQTPNTLLLDGSRAMTGDLDTGSSNIKLSGTSDAVIKQESLGMLGFTRGDLSTYIALKCGELNPMGWKSLVSTGYVSTYWTAPSYIHLKSHTGAAYQDAATLRGGNLEIAYGKLTGDLDVNANNIGPLLIDRTTATKYRLYVDNGVLNIESV